MSGPDYIQDSLLLEEAYELAADSHRDARRRRNSDMRHPIAVGELLHDRGYSDEVVAAGLMHELLEDTDTDLAEIEMRFGSRVAGLVGAMTEDPSIGPYEDRKAEHRARVAEHSTDAAAIYAADKLAKVRALERDGAPLDERKLEHYRRTLDELSEAYPELPFVDELDAELRALDAKQEGAARR